MDGGIAPLQLLGPGAFIVASLALGAKLLSLWRRTGELPELCVGLAFLLGGGLAYGAWFALGIAAGRGAGTELLMALVLLGLVATCLGSLANGVGVALTFRPGSRWPWPLLGGLALWMAGACSVYLLADLTMVDHAFWSGILAAISIYLWVAVEAFALAATLHKRARLGLADPVVVNRIAQWGVFGLAVVLMTAVSFASRLVQGPVPPPWVSALNAGIGLVGALAIWLGFFPPRSLRERLAVAYGA